MEGGEAPTSRVHKSWDHFLIHWACPKSFWLDFRCAGDYCIKTPMATVENVSEKTMLVSDENESCPQMPPTNILGPVVKGGRKQCQSEMAVIATGDYVILDGLQYVLPYSYDVP